MDWKTYSGETNKPGECYNFNHSYNFFTTSKLTQMVNFSPQIPNCDSHNIVPLDFFLSSDASTCSTIVFPPLRNYDQMWLSQFPLTFCQTQNGILCLIVQLIVILVLIARVFVII